MEWQIHALGWERGQVLGSCQIKTMVVYNEDMIDREEV